MKKGFTLIEVLITMAIVGVVAVLTVPNVIDNSSRRVYVQTLKTVNSSLNAAVNDIFTKEKVSSLADSTASAASTCLSNSFKLASYCGETYTDCLADSYKSLDKTRTITTNEMLSNKGFFCGILQSGVVICMTDMSNDSDNWHGRSLVLVDVNGKKKPNMNGRDLFNFELYSDGSIGNRYKLTETDSSGQSCSSKASTAGYGGACYSKVVADGWSMDY